MDDAWHANGSQRRETTPPCSESLAATPLLNDSAGSIPSHIVGLGAAAGGLEALETFFDNIRAESVMAYVVVQHLSPDFKSLMDQLLARHTEMAIVLRHAREMEAVRAIAFEMTQALDLSNLLSLMLQRALDLIDAASGGAVFLWDDAADSHAPMPRSTRKSQCACERNRHSVVAP